VTGGSVDPDGKEPEIFRGNNEAAIPAM